MENSVHDSNPISNITQPLAQGVQNAVTTPPNPNKIKAFISKNLSKIIFGVLGLVVLVELIWGGRSLLSPSSSGRAARVSSLIASMTDPKIVLVPSATNVKTGQSFDVKVNVVTGGKLTDSTDLVLIYDPNYLEASKNGITTGKIYSEYPVADLDGKGNIFISGITLPSKSGFSGIGTLATITFKTKKPGNTPLKIQYEKGATADSNVVESGGASDILSEVINTDITIGDSTQPVAQDPNSCPGYTQYCLTADGKTGRQFCKQGKKDGTACVFDPKLSVSCEVCKVEK